MNKFDKFQLSGFWIKIDKDRGDELMTAFKLIGDTFSLVDSTRGEH